MTHKPRSEYDQHIFMKSDPTFQKIECSSCGLEVYGDEIDENEVCNDCNGIDKGTEYIELKRMFNP